MATGSTGMKIMAASGNSCFQLGGSGFSYRYQATIMGTAIFMISEGWKRTTPQTQPALCTAADVARMQCRIATS